MVKTRLIFTLYTVYGILFKGEFCAYVRAPGVEGLGDVAGRSAFDARFYARHGPAWQREVSDSRSLSGCARVYVH